MENEIESVQVVENNVEYSIPKFWHRVMANLVDIVLFLITFFLVFAGVRAIVESTERFKQLDIRTEEIRLDSGLYKKSNDEILLITDYLEKYVAVYGSEYFGTSELSVISVEPTGRIGYAANAINQFISYMYTILPAERYASLVEEYDSIRLDTLTKNGEHYFIKDNEHIITNSVVSDIANNRQLYYENIYVPFIENYCLGCFSTYHEEYVILMKNYSNLLVFLEIPVSLFVSTLIIWFVPGLFFKRGRMSLGKAMYHIGLIDKKLLSPSLARFIARTAILFGEIVLSLVTLGIPFIISFSLMAFSKHKQGFPDYMLGLLEVDASKANIYMDYVEAQLKNDLHGQAIDFEMEKPL